MGFLFACCCLALASAVAVGRGGPMVSLVQESASTYPTNTELLPPELFNAEDNNKGKNTINDVLTTTSALTKASVLGLANRQVKDKWKRAVREERLTEAKLKDLRTTAQRLDLKLKLAQGKVQYGKSSPEYRALKEAAKKQLDDMRSAATQRDFREQEAENCKKRDKSTGVCLDVRVGTSDVAHLVRATELAADGDATNQARGNEAGSTKTIGGHNAARRMMIQEAFLNQEDTRKQIQALKEQARAAMPNAPPKKAKPGKSALERADRFRRRVNKYAQDKSQAESIKRADSRYGNILQNRRNVNPLYELQPLQRHPYSNAAHRDPTLDGPVVLPAPKEFDLAGNTINPEDKKGAKDPYGPVHKRHGDIPLKQGPTRKWLEVKYGISEPDNNSNDNENKDNKKERKKKEKKEKKEKKKKERKPRKEKE